MSKGDREHKCDEERGQKSQSLPLFAIMINLHNFTYNIHFFARAARGKKDDCSRSAYMICFPNARHVILLQRTVSFLLLHTHDVFKEKEQIPYKNHMNYNGEQSKC